jgi:hypothetical protein
LIDNGLQLNDIFKLYDNNKLNFKLKERFNNCEKHTQDIEKYYLENTELPVIPITKFIRNNYKKYRLFISAFHPSIYIYLYTTNEIIKIINKMTNQDIKIYDNIFNYKYDSYDLPCDNESWSNSIYIKNELDVEWIDNIQHYYNTGGLLDYMKYILKPNEEIVKKNIENIYNQII